MLSFCGGLIRGLFLSCSSYSSNVLISSSNCSEKFSKKSWQRSSFGLGLLVGSSLRHSRANETAELFEFSSLDSSERSKSYSDSVGSGSLALEKMLFCWNVYLSALGNSSLPLNICSMSRIISMSFLPGKSGLPVISSTKMHPTAQTSISGPYWWETRSSGALYHLVLTYSDKLLRCIWHACPKSHIFKMPFLLSNIFSGFMSQCIIPLACMWLHAFNIW